MVLKTFEIIEYFQPKSWFIENPRRGKLSQRPYMKSVPFVDVDYCHFSDWGYQKPTRIWGSPDIVSKPSRLCDGRTCPNLVPLEGQVPGKVRKHREPLGGPTLRVSAMLKGRIPTKVVEYLAGFTAAPQGQ